MIKKLIYLCPICINEDKIIQHKTFLYCSVCQTRFPFHQNLLTITGETYTVPAAYDLIRQKLILRNIPAGPELRKSGQAILRQGNRVVQFCGSDRQDRVIETPLEIDQGILIFEEERLVFKGKYEEREFSISDLTGFTTNSKYLEFKIKNKPFFQIFFRDESPLKYEDLMKLWYQESLHNHKFIEHQPKITYNLPNQPNILLTYPETNQNYKEKFTLPELMLHLFIGLPITLFFKWYANLEFLNGKLIPEYGPCIIIANHESYLDPILISTLSSRRIGFFTKSTSFGNRILQAVFRAYRSIPNKRYETDPIVIRQALRRLKAGHCVGIFPEGERTWDGRLRSFKLSTIKFLLSAQVPLILIKISGGYEVFPRWSKKVNRHKMTIEVKGCYSLLPGGYTVETLKAELEAIFRSKSE